MLSAAVDLTFDDDDWKTPGSTFLYRAASVGNSWGVTSIGRGFHWTPQKEEVVDSPVRAKEPLRQLPQPAVTDSDDLRWTAGGCNHAFSSDIVSPYTMVTPTRPLVLSTSALTTGTFSSSSSSPCQSRSPSPRPASTTSSSHRVSFSRSPSSPHSRRRSSQKRVSLIAGRVSIAPIEPPSPPPMLAPSLQRAGSGSSLLSMASSTSPPTPSEKESFLGGRSISEFAIDGEIGRGAYGLVKRGREIQADGSLGVRDVVLDLRSARIERWTSHLWS